MHMHLTVDRCRFGCLC